MSMLHDRKLDAGGVFSQSSGSIISPSRLRDPLFDLPFRVKSGLYCWVGKEINASHAAIEDGIASGSCATCSSSVFSSVFGVTTLVLRSLPFRVRVGIIIG